MIELILTNNWFQFLLAISTLIGGYVAYIQLFNNKTELIYEVRFYGTIATINNTYHINKDKISSYEVKKFKRSDFFALLQIIYILSLIVYFFSNEFEWSKAISIFIFIGFLGWLALRYNEAWKIKIITNNQVYNFKTIKEEDSEKIAEIERFIRN